MRLMRGFLITCLLLLAGCQFVPATATNMPTLPPTIPATSTATGTITATAMIMCTPPPCWEGEEYHCPGSCPGGCGTVCATRTPDPAASPTPPIPPFSEICLLATPVPGAASMAVCADRENPRVGEEVHIAVELTGVEYSDFVLITGQNSDDFGSFRARARTGGRSAMMENAGGHLVLDHIQSDGNRLYLVLTAQTAGAVDISLQVIPTVPDVRASLGIIVQP